MSTHKKSVAAGDPQYVTPAAILIIERTPEILDAWEQEARAEISIASQIESPVLIDTLPLFLTNLAQSIDSAHQREFATEDSSVAQEHGGERARITSYSPDQVLHEYRILRAKVEQLLEQHGVLDRKVHLVIARSFDLAIEEAVMAFHVVHTRLRERFVATLSHDLRNPMGAAKLAAELLLHVLDDPPEQATREKAKSLVHKIITNIKRTDRMIQNLLDSSVVQTGEHIQLDIQKDALDIFIKPMLEDMPPEISERITIEHSSGEVFCDFELIRRAVENLVLNAIKYGDSKSQIHLKMQTDWGRAVLSVHNFGNPIPLEEQGRLFQFSHRTDAAKRSGKRGWGLGLAFVRAVCEAHGGSIGVESSEAAGTTFTIDIPADTRPFVRGPVA